jgi:outer membrane beta-barrel protein
MRLLALAALLCSSFAHAVPRGPVVSLLLLGQAGTAPVPQGADQEEGEDRDAAAAPQTPAPGGSGATTSGSTERSAPAQAAGAAPTPSPSASAEAQTLVSGAPLYNPNVAVHIVERKVFSDKGKHELALFPAVAQLNGKFTQHYGTALNYTYHLQENFALQITPQWNWFNTESAFNNELINTVGEEAQAATSLLLSWGVLGGVEVVPLYGKFAWYENSLLQYSVVINAGAGYGSTRHQLRPENKDVDPPIEASFGDTGNRFLGSIGGGFRVQFGGRFAVRLEVRDLVYTARVDRVNGCDIDDFIAMQSAPDPTRASVKRGCRADKFGTTDLADLTIAKSLVEDPTSDVLNLVSLYAGASFIF